MNMKEHILAALQEQFNRWEEFLSSLTEAQVTAPHLPSHWSTKDEIAHLWAWQQRSIARLEAALSDREPKFPEWVAGLESDALENTDRVNEWIYQANRDLPWAKVHQNWREGFLRFLELGGKMSEIDLLAEGKYSWLNGAPVVFVLVASYDHHQEHWDKMVEWHKE